MSQKDQDFLSDEGDSVDFEHGLTGQTNQRNSLRPQSGYRKSGTASYSFKEHPAFKMFNRYIKFHRIPIRFFWKKSRINITLQQFKQLLQEMDFKATPQFKKAVREKLMTGDFINMQYLCSFVEWWADRPDEIEALALELAKKEEAQRQKKRRYSSSKLIKSALEPSIFKQPKVRSRPLKTNIEYLRERKAKQQEKGKEIEDQIQNRISELKYNMLLKVGEANQIISKLGLTTKYTVLNKDHAKMVVCRNDVELSESEFRKEFGQLSRQLRLKKHLKYWQCAESKKALRKLKATEEKNNQVRDEQLKKILVETIKLTIDLKRQIELFDQKGINSIQAPIIIS